MVKVYTFHVCVKQKLGGGVGGGLGGGLFFVFFFRKSVRLKQIERWLYNEDEVEIVNQFTYLGLTHIPVPATIGILRKKMYV